MTGIKVERRRAFGLDHARHADPLQLARQVTARLADARPDLMPLRLARADGSEAPVLLLLAHDGPMAMLRLGRRRRPDRAVLELETAARRLRIPSAAMTRVEDLPGALRTCGLGPEDE